MKINKPLIKEGKRILKRRLQTKNHHRFEGGPREICKKIADKNWNGKYFQASLGHFKSFYMRDFGMSTEALIYMGYKHEVEKTLEYILGIYEKNNKVTTTITPDGIPIDIFDYGSDSVPYLIRSLRIAKAHNLIKQHHDFLESMVNDYYNKLFDEKKMIVYENKSFSSMKDNSKRKSSMYDNCCMAMLSMELNKLKEKNILINNPFFKWNYKKVIRDRFWVGTHFLDDISNHHYISGDANTIPYFFEIFTDKDMMTSSINTIIGEKLDLPIPAKYTAKPIKEKENSILGLLAPNYQGDTCWTNLGMIFLDVAGKVNKLMLKKYIDVFLEHIEDDRNFLEVFDKYAKPYKTKLYMYDEGMLWSSMFYQLLDEFYKPGKIKYLI